MAGRYGLEIRGATAADAPGLAELMSVAGLRVAPRLLAERLEALQDEPGVVLVAVEWGLPSGVIALGWRRTLEADTPTAQITTLLVGPNERRRGVARLLLKAGAQAARIAGCGLLQLRAPSGHPDLEAFCRATGFADASLGFERALRKRV